MLSRLDKLWIALTSIGLGALLLGALGLAALIMMSGCAKPAAATSHPEEPLRVVVMATVPGDAWFCMEDPHIDGTLRQPAVRFGHIVCPLTVNQLRRAINQLQATD